MIVPSRAAPRTTGLLVERLDNACPLFRYRVSYGGTHAVGPTEDEAMASLARALGWPE